jgi:TPR repeat protein
MRWYRKAADQGLGVAEWNIAMLFAQGQGVARDIDQARYWMSKAAADGSTGARQWLANH